MLAIERKNEILNKLRAEQRVLVSELAAHYGVTEETIRRDLDKLEKEGHATKTYGGAIWGNSTKTDRPASTQQEWTTTQRSKKRAQRPQQQALRRPPRPRHPKQQQQRRQNRGSTKQ